MGGDVHGDFAPTVSGGVHEVLEGGKIHVFQGGNNGIDGGDIDGGDIDGGKKVGRKKLPMSQHKKCPAGTVRSWTKKNGQKRMSKYVRKDGSIGKTRRSICRVSRGGSRRSVASHKSSASHKNMPACPPGKRRSWYKKNGSKRMVKDKSGRKHWRGICK